MYGHSFDDVAKEERDMYLQQTETSRGGDDKKVCAGLLRQNESTKVQTLGARRVWTLYIPPCMLRVCEALS